VCRYLQSSSKLYYGPRVCSTKNMEQSKNMYYSRSTMCTVPSEKGDKLKVQTKKQTKTSKELDVQGFNKKIAMIGFYNRFSHWDSLTFKLHQLQCQYSMWQLKNAT
jgi:hypothetical protein